MMRLAAKENVKQRPAARVYEVAAAACLGAGCLGTLFTMFRPPIPFLLVLVLTAGMPAGAVCLGRVKGLGKYLAFYVLLLAAAFVLLFYGQVLDGFLQMIDRAVSRLNAQLGTGYLDYRTTGGLGNVLCALLPLLAVISAAIGQSLVRGRPLLGFAFTAAPVAAGLFFGGAPSVWMLLLLTLGWAGLFLPGRDAGGLLVLAAGLLVLGGLSLAFTDAAWQPIPGLDAAKEKFIAWEETKRFGGDEIDGLSEGDLTRTHPLKYDDQSAFTLQMQMGQSLYLRGFAGATYADGKWSPAEDSAYGGNYRGLCQYLQGKGYYPWCQEDAMYRLDPNYTFTQVEVTNRRASAKYMWLPYETAVAADAKAGSTRYDQDRTPLAEGFRGRRAYTLKIFDSGLKDYDAATGDQMRRVLAKQDGFDEYLEKEELYRTFVYETYLDVDEELRQPLEELGLKKCEGKDLDYCIYRLRDAFTKEFTYDTETKAAPKGQEPLTYFLTGSRQGNGMHFATAAVLFLRAAGFPARYAEGYYVSPDQIEVYDELQNVKIPVADSASHAWAEVYADGLGWMPLEVTPGFYDMEKRKSREKEETEDLTETTQQSYPDELEVDEDTASAALAQPGRDWIILLACILGALALVYGIRRMLLARRKDAAGSFRHLARVLAMDGIRIEEDPYRVLALVSERYDGETRSVMAYGQALRLYYQDRFSLHPISDYEKKQLDEYSRDVARGVYQRLPWYKRLWMRYIRVLV